MKPVSAKTIDAVIDQLDGLSEEQYAQRMEAFAEAQPVLMAYLFNDENFHLLGEEEKGYLQYLALIVYTAFEKENGAPDAVGEDAIGEAEERNYEIMESSPAKKFSARLDPFFEGYPQEDLLAFAEEAVLEDEDDPDGIISREAREPIFIALKTMIDVLQGA